MSDPRPPEEPGELVEGGAFRIDRAVALEKLRQYQLPDPWLFVNAWARAAVLSEATRLDCVREGDASVLRFDGKPFLPSFLEGPYEAMFSEDFSSPARHAAIGILGAQRLAPFQVSVVSGGRGWSWGRDGEESTFEAPGQGTSLRVRWPAAEAAGRHREFEGALTKACGMLRIPLGMSEAYGTPLAVLRASSGGRSVAGERRQAVYQRAPDAPKGVIVLYRDGIRVGEPEFPGFELVSVHLNDDSIDLDLSGCSFRDDKRVNGILIDALEEAERFLPRSRRVHGRLPGEIPKPLAVLVLGGISFAFFHVAAFAWRGGEAAFALGWSVAGAAMARLAYEAGTRSRSLDP